MKIYELEDADLAKKVSGYHKTAKDASSKWREGAKEDFNFQAGHQWDESDVQKLENEHRPYLTFNRCDVLIASIQGLEANQRNEVKFNPREKGDTALSDAISQVIDWCRTYAEIDNEEAQVFHDQLVCGMGWSETRIDYDEDLNGKIMQEQVDAREMYWDNTACKRNLKDAGWVVRAKKMSVDEITETWPESDIALSESFEIDDDNYVEYNNPTDAYNEEIGGQKSQKTRPVVLQFQWYEKEPVYRIIGDQTGRIIEIEEDRFKKLKDFFDSKGMRYLKQSKRKYYEAFVCGNTLLEKKECASQIGFTFKCVTGKHDRINNEFYGIIRLAKDPQKWANKFFSTFIDIIDSNSKGGVMFETGAVADVRKFEETWSRADVAIQTNPGALSQGKIQPKPVAQYPNAVDRLMQYAVQSIYDVTGVNLEMLGAVDRNQPGVVETARKKSAYTILAHFFDAYSNFKKGNGILLLEFIKNYLPSSVIERVLEPELAPITQQIKEMEMRGLDVIVTESPYSENMKEITWSFMMNVLPGMMKMGLPIPPEILEYSPLPATLTAKWQQLIEERKNNQEAEMQKQLDIKGRMAEVAKTEGLAKSSEARTVKTMEEAKQLALETEFTKNIMGGA